MATPRAFLAAACVLSIGCVGTVGEQREALGFPNDQTAFDYFVGKGLADFQSAGIVGNLDVESGVDPHSVESNGPGRGIAQWSVGARWDTTANDNVLDFATTEGLSATSLTLQLDFIWYELTSFSAYGLDSLQATTTLSGATISFSTHYEGCGSCSNAQRIADAQHVLDTYGSMPIDFSVGPDAATATSCSIAGTDGVCIDVSDCGAGHVATPGHCAGASNIQCCTPTTSAADLAQAPPGDAATATPSKGCDYGDAPLPRWSLLLVVAMALYARRRAYSTFGG